MRPGVVLAEALTTRRLHADRDVFALAKATAAHAQPVDDELRTAIVRVEDLAAPAAPDQRAGVPHLTARLGVGRGAIEDHLHLGAFGYFPHAPESVPGVDEGQDPRR